MADDLGMGDLGCYGQKVIKTPAIDTLAAHGMKFTQHYSGSTVSAPSRASLLTGLHTGNAFIRGNKGVKDVDNVSYDYPLPEEIETVAKIAQRADYATACIGKWGLGAPQSSGHPNKQGFDYFFGYLGQANAHRYYPNFLHENENKVYLQKAVYSHDTIMSKALEYIEEKAKGGRPFFLYLTPTIPHADLILPEGQIGEYDGLFPETPYKGGYTAQDKPRATFAAMVSRLDRDVARIMKALKDNQIEKNTIVIFTSDNGTHKEGGHDPFFFHSSGGFRGTKRDLYEGGIRTPFIVHWPEKIAPKSVSFHLSAFWDFLPTVCEIVGQPIPQNTDGISYLPALTGEGKQKQHEYLYWEFHEQGGKQAVRLPDGWKLIKLHVNDSSKTSYELYNIAYDPTEQSNVAHQYPQQVSKLKKLIHQAHSHSPLFPFAFEK